MALAATCATLKAQAIYTSGHGDIGTGYGAGEFDPHWHMHAGAIVDGLPLAADEEFAPADMNARGAATRNSPTGLSPVIGLPDGTTIFAIGSSAYQPNLGFGSDELDPLDWSGDITVSLTSWTLPSGTAALALYTTNLSGTTVIDAVFSTFSPPSTFASNSFTMTPGDHLHFQWGFTEAGIYTVDLTWTGTHAIDGAISTTDSFTIQVVPEPSAFANLGLGLLGWLACRRRRIS
jgi:surface-anchored protein